MNGFAATLTAEPYFGRLLELPECATVLGRFSFEAVVGRVVLLRHVNDEVFADPDSTPAGFRGHLLQTLRFIFDEARAERAWQEALANENFRPLSDQALLATLELARFCCLRDGQHWIKDDADRLDLTHVILSFQSVLLSRTLAAQAVPGASLEGLGEPGWAEFIRNRMAHNTSHYYRRALGRLFALCMVPEVGQPVAVRTGRPIGDWFMECFGLTPEEYCICAFLSAGPALRLNRNAPDAGELFFRESTFWGAIRTDKQGKLRSFLALASQPVGERTEVPSMAIDEYLYSAAGFHVRPVLDLGLVSICVSPHLMMNKFIVGLPYLAQDARERALGRKLNDDERKACRAPFGILFESYIVWLFRQLLMGWTATEIIAGVYCGPTAQHGECDLVIVRRDTAFVFEIKTTMATLAFRQSGAFSGLDAMLETGAKQAYRAAQALRAGKAVRAADGSVIEGIRYVVPCVVTYGEDPLYHPFSEFYEWHLAKKTGLPFFTANDGIEPLQFLEVEFLESWESEFDLSPESGAPFGYLTTRARDLELRHKAVQTGVAAGKRPEASTPFDDIARQSKAHLQKSGSEWLKAPAGDPAAEDGEPSPGPP